MKKHTWVIRGILLGVYCLVAQLTYAQTLKEVIALHQKSVQTTSKSKLTSMVLKGTTTMGGMEFATQVYRKAPHFFKVEVTIQGKTLVNAYDGVNAWKIYPFPGGSDKPQYMAGAAKTSTIIDADFDYEFINAAKKGHKATLEGTEEVEGTTCYKIKVVRKDQQVKAFFLDTDSGVLIMVRGKSVHPMKPDVLVEKETYQSDFKEVEGYMIAHYMEERIDGKVIAKMQFDSVQVNEKISNKIFTFSEKQ
ncbi:outer membrane lipoprotein-sorting protein [Microscilla marina]|uniref:Uncharacterized protein TP-0789 domain-containing protein n=1 Tax=Microscilla marina ATCC 23134 TaxID=313606 RepID=A1ZF53_MICM2|nr:outer membrane lipoprotein-sorting protein [Microscilla marina]EAY31155.1 hypothetical protein M23134_07565 [Microscilla marina ATCC 23134]